MYQDRVFDLEIRNIRTYHTSHEHWLTIKTLFTNLKGDIVDRYIELSFSFVCSFHRRENEALFGKGGNG